LRRLARTEREGRKERWRVELKDTLFVVRSFLSRMAAGIDGVQEELNPDDQIDAENNLEAIQRVLLLIDRLEQVAETNPDSEILNVLRDSRN
jgi:hypothetical protein